MSNSVTTKTHNAATESVANQSARLGEEVYGVYDSEFDCVDCGPFKTIEEAEKRIPDNRGKGTVRGLGKKYHKSLEVRLWKDCR